MTKRELAAAIVNSDERKNWYEYLKETEIKRLARDSKAQLEKVYNYKKEKGEIK